MKRDIDLDSIMKIQEDYEKKLSGSPEEGGGEAGRRRVLIGKVERYFPRIGVAAVKLSSSLSVGEIIEIGGEDEAIRQKVGSMQINKKAVESADAGDEVGILLRWPVDEGADVYKIIDQ